MEKRRLENLSVDEQHYAYNFSVPVGAQVIHVRGALRQIEREAMAQDMAGGMLVFDEEAGLVYEGYNRETVRVLSVLKYYTDLDVSDFDTADGRYVLYDILDSTGALKQIMELIEDDLFYVDSIYHSLRMSAQKTFEHTHSLQYLAQKSFGSLLTGEDITESLVKASAINNQMVDMLGALRREKAAKPSVGGNVMQFGRKDK